MDEEGIERVASQIVDSAIHVHRALGPGLLESVYQQCLAYELRLRGLHVDCEVVLPVRYGEIEVDGGYRIDMVVEKCVLIENKNVEGILPIHKAQMMTYLRLSGVKLGFLLNWNVVVMKRGICRFVNGLPESQWHKEKLITKVPPSQS